jgi:hypothetical protein
MMKLETDEQRLNWLAEQEGSALISDDFGNWAVSFAGMQNIPENPGTPSDIHTSFFVEAAEWRPSIREAIDAAACTYGE